MKLEQKLEQLPLIKTDQNLLQQLFGRNDLTPMWVADMDFQVATFIQDAIIERVKGSGFAYEFHSKSFKEAQKLWYKNQYGILLDENKILYSPSIPTSIGLILETFTEEGQGVILQTPVFFDFKHIIKKHDRKIVNNPLKYQESKYTIDFDNLEELAAKNENKVLIFTNPHNPVGRVWTKEEVNKVVEIAEKYNLILISDEIHKDIILYENTFNSILTVDLKKVNAFVLTSEAKTFNINSISDAMTIVNLEESYEKLSKQFEKMNFGRPNAITAVAVEAAYNHGKEWLDDLKVQLEKNIDIVNEGLVGSKIKLVQPEGTFLIWLDFNNLFDNPKTLLNTVVEETKLALNSGHWFGREGAGFLRMNIATSSEKVRKAIKALREMESKL